MSTDSPTRRKDADDLETGSTEVFPARGSSASADALLRLESILRALGHVAVAFSGGVDSTLLYSEARRVLGERAVAAIAVSPSLGSLELEHARTAAASLGPLLEIETRELDDPNYRANRGDRCYFCKAELFDRFMDHPDLQGFVLCDGTHAGDPVKDRPGMRAARERQVRSPLRDAGFDKPAIRELALQRGLSCWDRPARPCLASRVRVGTPVSGTALSNVERLEAVLAARGFREVRVRVTDEEAVVTLGQEELSRLGEEDWRRELTALGHELGYLRVFADLDGYGSST